MITFEQAGTLRKGDVLRFWHDTIAFGAAICYAQFVSTGPKREFLTVIDERGEVCRAQRGVFDRKVAHHEWRPKCFDPAGEFLE